MLVVWRSISPAMRSLSCSRQRMQSITPGRDFFIPTGTVNASSAPAASSSSSAKPTASPVMSSTLQLSSVTVSPAEPLSPSIARTQFAASKSFLPMP